MPYGLAFALAYILPPFHNLLCRYPNNHTYLFSCILLQLFQTAQKEIIPEQITRVLLERLIVNRPHPWGLLITFIELVPLPNSDHAYFLCDSINCLAPVSGFLSFAAV